MPSPAITFLPLCDAQLSSGSLALAQIEVELETMQFRPRYREPPWLVIELQMAPMRHEVNIAMERIPWNPAERPLPG
jgi:hypothetical protein